MPRKKQAMTTFEGGEGATASVTVVKKSKQPAPRVSSKKDPAMRQKKRYNQDLRWSGVRSGKR
jgi:hypothetical protein